MPNYGLVINSRFRPFSYQEMLAPVQQSTEAHQALENAYEELNTNASIWEGLANKESDPITYQRYKNFADALKTQADELAANGLNPTSRQAVSNLRARYASDIIPIKNAYEKRQADIKAQQEILLKDPTHFFDKKASETSLDEYLTNDKLDVLSDQYSGALLTQQVGQAAQALKNTLTNKGALSKLGLPYQYERMLQYGKSADDVLKAMSRDPQAAPILTKLVDDVMAASGIRNWSSMNGDWANNDMYRRAEAYAMQGLYNAIGTSKIDNFTDSYSMQNALAQQEFNRKLALTGASANANRLAPSSIDLWDTGGYNERAKSIQEKMGTINSTSGNPMAIYEFYHNNKERDKYFKDKPYIKKNRTEALHDETLLAEAKKEQERINQKVINNHVNDLKRGLQVVVNGKAITLADYNRDKEKYNKMWRMPQTDNSIRMTAGILYDRARANADSMWRQHVLDTYGVSDIIDSKDYDFLQTLGLDNSSNFNEQYRNAIDNTAKQYTLYGANLSDYSHEKNRLTSNINNAISNNKYSGRVYKLNADGTQGEAISSKEIRNFITDSKNGINDIYYSNLHKGRIIIVTDLGQQLIVDPSLLDSGLNNMITNMEQGIVVDPSTGGIIQIDKNDPNLSRLITMSIADKLNAINPRRNKTNQNA